MSLAAPPRSAAQVRPERTPRPRRDEREERHLRVVAPVRHRGRRRLLSFFVLVAFFVVLLGTATFHVRLVTGQQRIDRLDKQAQQSQATYDRLRLQVDKLSAPDRIVARARALGMVDAGEPTWLAPGSPAITRGTDDPATGLRNYLDVKPYLGDTP